MSPRELVSHLADVLQGDGFLVLHHLAQAPEGELRVEGTGDTAVPSLAVSPPLRHPLPAHREADLLLEDAVPHHLEETRRGQGTMR